MRRHVDRFGRNGANLAYLPALSASSDIDAKGVWSMKAKQLLRLLREHDLEPCLGKDWWKH